jgi:hypothetical protein
MVGKLLATLMGMAFAISLGAATDAPLPQANLSAASIADRNVAARGGLQAWRAVHTLKVTGKLGAGGNRRDTLPLPVSGRQGAPRVAPQRPAAEAELPFVMEMRRPRKIRYEIQFNGQTAVQVFDGTNGWKLRPFLNRSVVEPYTAEEMKMASLQPDLDGPVVDYAAKGTQVALEGVEKVEDRDTYKLKLTAKNGQVTHVWIDSQTFLEAKIEGQPRRLDGVSHPVEIYYHDFRPVNGLEMPFEMETRVLPVAPKAQAAAARMPAVPVEKISIETVTVNPNIEEALFSKPAISPVSNTR